MQYQKSIEKFGINHNSSIDVEIEYSYQPEEPMVEYYANGDGYPGCPAYMWLEEFYVTQYQTNTHLIKRKDRPDWFVVLDRIAKKYCLENREDIETEIKINKCTN